MADQTPLLYVGTHGTDDPTLATMPFVLAKGAVEAHIDVNVALLGEAAALVKPGMIEAVHGVGFSPLSDLSKHVRDYEVPVYV